MTWQAKITSKSALTTAGTITYLYDVLLDGEVVFGKMEITSDPSTIQTDIARGIKVLAEKYTVADALPGVGDVLDIETDVV